MHQHSHAAEHVHAEEHATQEGVRAVPDTHEPEAALSVPEADEKRDRANKPVAQEEAYGTDGSRNVLPTVCDRGNRKSQAGI